MTNHPRADAPGNVPLWRCDKKNNPACDATGKPGDCWNSHHHLIGEMCRLCTGAFYEIVGFRTPSTLCDDCQHAPKYPAIGRTLMCAKRVPTTAEDDLIKVICEETKLVRREKP